jgi:hypothetical protein
MRLLRLQRFLENDKTAEYKFAYKLVANKFEFKTQEGTYLHGIAETFQGPIMLTRLSIRGKKVRAFVFC